MSSISFTYRVDDVLTDPDSVVLSDPSATYGMRRTDTLAVVIADGTAMTNDGTGLYSYDLDGLDLDSATYDYYIEVVDDDETYHFQRSITITDAANERTINFVVVREGAVEVIDSPELSSPQGNYGVQRVDTHETIVDDGTQMEADGLGWTYTINDVGGDANTVYRYYVEVVLAGGTGETTYWVPRTTNFVKTACLVLGRYCTSLDIERRFGAEEVIKWLGVGDAEETIEYALRYSRHIDDAESYLDDELRGTTTVPIDEDDVTAKITDLAVDLAALRMYESRGVQDIDPITGFAMHRLSFVQKRVDREIAKLKGGVIRLAGDSKVRIPSVVTD